MPKPVRCGDQVIFQEIECGHNQLLRVYRDIFKGRELLSIRKFWREDEDDPEWKPGKGVTFHDEQIEGLIEGLQGMQTWLRE